MKVKMSFTSDFPEATRVSTKEIKYSNYGKNEQSSDGKSKSKDKKKDYSKERKQKRGE